MRATRLTKLAAGVALPAALLSCTVDETLGTDALRRVPIVFAVLEAQGAEVRVLVERSQVGAPGVLPDSAFEPGASILARGGDPVCGARVVLYDARGDSAVARERREPAQSCDDPLGRPGEYLAINSAITGCDGATTPCIAIVTGGRYRLRVETDLGIVTGETRVPEASDVVLTAGGARFEDIDLPASLVRGAMTIPGASFYHVSYGRDPWLGALSIIPPQLGIDRLALSVRGASAAPATRGRLFVENTLADPCSAAGSGQQDEAAVRIAVVDSNYAAFLVAARDRQLLDDRTAPTGVRGGRGVFGAARQIAVWRLRPRFVANDTGVVAAPAPLGRWTPGTLDGVELPTICMAELRDAIPGTLRIVAGVARTSSRARPTRVVAELRRDTGGGEQRVSATVSALRAGETRPVDLSLDGRLVGDTLELVVRQPVDLVGREVRWVRLPF